MKLFSAAAVGLVSAGVAASDTTQAQVVTDQVNQHLLVYRHSTSERHKAFLIIPVVVHGSPRRPHAIYLSVATVRRLGRAAWSSHEE